MFNSVFQSYVYILISYLLFDLSNNAFQNYMLKVTINKVCPSPELFHI